MTDESEKPTAEHESIPRSVKNSGTDESQNQSRQFTYRGDPATIIAVYRGKEEDAVLVRDEDGNNHVVPYVMFGDLLDKVSSEVIFRHD